MKDLPWPSFAIQGIIIGIATSFLLKKNGEYINLGTLLSVLFVFSLFALQTTSFRWIYLFPVRYEPNRERTIDVSYWDTWILRGFIVLAAFFYLWVLLCLSIRYLT